MIVTAYIDESGVHAGASRIVMGGIVGTLGKWNALEQQWDRLLKQNGLECFHSKDVVQNSGSKIKNIGYEGRVQLTADLQKLYKKYIASMFRSLGIAMISLDFSATLT